MTLPVYMAAAQQALSSFRRETEEAKRQGLLRSGKADALLALEDALRRMVEVAVRDGCPDGCSAVGSEDRTLVGR